MAPDKAVPAGSTSQGRWLLAICVSTFVLALAVRTIGLGERSFWLDEAETIADIRATGVNGVLARVGAIEGGKGPLYFLMLKAWAALFGESEFALRLPSALLGSLACVLAVVWASLLGNHLGPCSGGVQISTTRWLVLGMTGVFTSLNPTLVTVSREARTYAFSHTFILAAAVLAVPAYLATESRWTRVCRVACPVVGALGVSAHLLSAYFLGAAFLASVVVVLRRRGSLRPLVFGAGTFLALLATQYSLTRGHVAAHYGGGAAPAVGVRDLAHYALELLGGKPGAFAVVGLLAVAILMGWRDPRVRFAIGVCAAGVATALAVHEFVLPTLFGGARYLAWVSFAIPIVFVGLELTRPRMALGAVGLLGLALVGSLAVWRSNERAYAEDWRTVSRVLEEREQAGSVVICHRGYVATPLRLYYRGQPSVISCVPSSKTDTPCSCIAQAERFRGAGSSVLLVWSHAESWESRRAEFEAALGPAEVVHEQYAIRVLRFGR